ncbi:HNH endonuclease signature motif containing protein [Myxococcaceae bacterium GXIMD 01537]
MRSLPSRALSLLLALLLSGVAPLASAGSPAGSRESVRGSVRIPRLIVSPGTPDERVVAFAEDEGPLTTGEALTHQEVRSLLSTVAARTSHPALSSVARKLSQGRPLEDWEWKLWRDYLAYAGKAGVSTDASREDMHPTADDRRDMALRVALDGLLPGLAEQMAEDFQPHNLALTAIMAVLTTYLLLWAVPEPITKVAAVGITLTLVAAFGARLLLHVVDEWKLLCRATLQARDFSAVKAAGLRFGQQLGADGARLLYVLASLALGHAAGPAFSHLPRPPAPGAAWVAELSGGVRVPVAQVHSVTLAHDSLIVTMAAGSSGTVTAGSLNEGVAPRGPRRFSKADRDAAYEKSKDASGKARCEYCDEELTREPGKANTFEADHRRPYSKGGESKPDNASPSCRACNREKGDKELGTGWVPPKER